MTTKRAGYVDLYKDAKSKWRWRIVAPNGKILADSSEGYTRRRDCENGLERVIGGDAKAWASGK